MNVRKAINRIGENSARRALHSDLFLNIMGRITRNVLYRNDKLSFKIWLRHFFGIVRDSMLRRKPVMWTSIYVPSELIYSMGCIPFHVEIFALIAAHLNVSGEMIRSGEGEGYSSDLCSCYRCSAGLGIRSFFPRPDMIISSSHLCDGSTAFFRKMARYYGVPHFLIDVPYRNDAGAKAYVSKQIKNIIREVEGALSSKFSMDKLEETLSISNETRKYHKRFNMLREHVPSPFSGADALTYVAAMIFMSMGTYDGLSFFRILCQEAGKNIKNSRTALSEERHRILWLHQVRPYYKNSIFSDLEADGAVIVFEEVSHIYWPPYDLEEPITSLAVRMMENINLGPIERRMEAIKDMVKRYSIDGIIHFSQWGCRQSTGGAYILRNYFTDQGIPFLVLNGDCADPSNYAEGQTKTRIQAFLEILRGNR